MKQLKIVFVACILAACNKPHQAPRMTHASQVSVIYDITDSLACCPLADPILSLYDFEHDQEPAAAFRLVLITDKQLNPVEEIHIDDGTTTERSNTNEEIDYREQLVNSYYDAVRKAIISFHKQYVRVKPLGHSECFATISSELGRLAPSKASQRTLIVYSDLQENTDVFSCYRLNDLLRLKTNPIEVGRLLQRRCPLPANLIGVTVYFVYQPMDRNQDQRFSAMVNIYRELLRVRGAGIVIQATNKQYEP